MPEPVILKWKKVEPGAIPEEEVLALYDVTDEMPDSQIGKMVGFISADEESNSGFVVQDRDCNDLMKCTHYILVSDLLKLPKE